MGAPAGHASITDRINPIFQLAFSIQLLYILIKVRLTKEEYEKKENNSMR